jgi:hypothetical protein
MTKEEFGELFLKALTKAVEFVEHKHSVSLPRQFLIALHSPKSSGERMQFGDALDHLYLAPDRFFKIIDVAVIELIPNTSVMFVRVSGHAPAEFASTLDTAQFGPFKIIEAAQIKDNRDGGLFDINKLFEIRNFFASHFHEDWAYEADNADQIVRNYAAENKIAHLTALSDALLYYIDGVEDRDLEELLFQELRCYYVPSRDGILARDWLKTVARLLVAP